MNESDSSLSPARNRLPDFRLSQKWAHRCFISLRICAVGLATVSWLALARTAAAQQPAGSIADAPNKGAARVLPLTEDAVKPAALPGRHASSRFALAFKSSSLGLGADLGTRLTNHMNIRVGFNGFNYSRTVSNGGIAYLGRLQLRSLQALVDCFPWSRGIHFSPGLLLYDGNHVTANALLPTGKILSSGTESFVSNPQNPLVGSAQSSMRKVAPIMLVGVGNLVPRTRHFAASADFGIVFQGLPSTQVSLVGSACDVSGAHCRDVSRDASIQADIRSGEKTMQNDLSIMRFYPVISIDFGYRF